MAPNDLLVLDAAYSDWLEHRATGIDHPFVYYCAEQFLKVHVPTDEDISYGIVDGGNDGGVDAIYFIVDRNEFIRDDSDADNKKPSRARLVVLQAKESQSGFSMNEINKLSFFSEDLLDLSQSADTPECVAKYNMHLREIMETFKDKYLAFATSQLAFSIDYYYVTKGDELKPDSKAIHAAEKITSIAKKHMTKAEVEFHFINAQRLLDQVNLRISKEKALQWAYQPMDAPDGVVGIVHLADFYDFLKEPDGSLSEGLFEANVRGFQQDTAVNKQIRDSLLHPDTNFWLLNNGITIIAENTASAGHLRVTCQDPQIVNGLQSSRAIFRHFAMRLGNTPPVDDRSILVRLIETQNEKVRDRIIRATNSQNKMEAASLRSTDPVHHEIEQFMKRFGLHYDRRKGYHKDKGVPARDIASVIEVTKAIVAIVVQRADDARARAGNYLRRDSGYAEVFGKWTDDGWVDALPLGTYVTCVQIVRLVEQCLKEEAKVDDELRGHEHNLRFYIAMYVACATLRTTRPDPESLATTKTATIPERVIRDCYKRVWKSYDMLGRTDTVAKGTDLNTKLLSQIRRRYRKLPQSPDTQK